MEMLRDLRMQMQMMITICKMQREETPAGKAHDRFRANNSDLIFQLCGDSITILLRILADLTLWERQRNQLNWGVICWENTNLSIMLGNSTAAGEQMILTGDDLY